MKTMAKIVILAMIALLAVPALASGKKDTHNNEMQFNVMIDLPAKCTLSYEGLSESVEIGQGVTIGAEFLNDKNYGFGLMYLIERSKLSSTVPYILVRSQSKNAGVQGNIGYTLLNVSNTGDFKIGGGLYLGTSCFVLLSDTLKAQAAYNLHNGTMSYQTETINLQYQTFSLGLALVL